MTLSVDLNSDVGESFGVYTLGRDENVLKHVSSANIACGYHAGDHNVMMKTVLLAKSHGVAIGAHPGLPDLAGFGRREFAVSPQEVYNLMVYQIGALQGIAIAAKCKLQHVKPHGALYNMAARNRGIAEAVVEAVKDIDRNLILMALAGSLVCSVGRQAGLTIAEEVFADRAYEADGTLTPRSEPAAMLPHGNFACERVVGMLKERKVSARDGSILAIRADTICVHGDDADAGKFAAQLKETLQHAGIAIRPVEPAAYA